MELGTVIADRYRVDRLASRGGMGTVYRGYDLRSGLDVGIKLIHPTQDPGSSIRFFREAETLAGLRHPGIVKHLHHGVTFDGQPYLVMEWVAGETLRDVLRRGQLDIADALRIGIRLCDAMAVPHGCGIIHRDIKPANLLLPRGQITEIKIADFGLARLVDTATSLTGPGQTLGTPSFMAPEQARGAADLDQRADIYSIGAVLFNCLVGRPPYIGDHSTAILAKVLFGEVPRPSQFRRRVPTQLDHLIVGLLAKQPDDRPSDVHWIGRELTRLLDELLSSTGSWEQSTNPAVTVGEQRFVTVLVVHQDPAGSARERRAALTRYAQIYGGALEELANGTISGVFATEGSPEQLSARAAECALAIRTDLNVGTVALATGRSELSGPLPQGPVIDRAVALLFGDADTIRTDVQTVARDASAPPRDNPEGIVVDEVTAGLLDRRFAFEHAGFDRFYLVSDGRSSTTSPRLLGLPTRCVGRQRELDALQGALDQCLDEHTSYATLLLAPAGGGKTRLCYEFVSRVSARYSAVAIWSASADWLRARAAGNLIAQLLRQALGVVEGRPLDWQRAHIARRVRELVSSDDADRVTWFLGELAGVPFDSADHLQLDAARQNAQLMHDQITRAFLDWLGAELDLRPVLIVLEDLHWADRPTLGFLDAALTQLAERPLMIMASARPTISDRFPKVLDTLPVDVVRLRPLSRHTCKSLIDQVLDVSDEVAQALVERSEGNAFFIEELIRHVASGRTDEIPETVLAVAESRLRALPSELRRVLRAASVLGRSFWSGGIAALMGEAIEPDELDRHLSELVYSELIVTRKASRFVDHAEYAFRHELTREAAYGSLTEHDRERAHLRAGAWLEEVGETEAIVLAEHYKRGGAFGRAITWYTAAARQALDANDPQCVIEHVEHALRCGASGEVLGRLRLLAAEVHNWRNEHEQAAMHSQEAIALLDPGSDAWANAIHHSMWAAATIGETDAVMALIPALIEHASKATDGTYLIAMAHIATHVAVAGDREQARALEAAIHERVARISASLAVHAAVTHMRSCLAFMNDEFDRACELMQEAAGMWLELGDERSALLDLGNAGSAQLELGEYQAAAATLGVAVRKAREHGLDHLRWTNQASRALALARAGRCEEAKKLCHQTIVSRPAARHEVIARTYLAQILLDGDGAQEAVSHTREALNLADNSPGLKAFVLGVNAQALLRLGHTQQALDSAREGMEIFTALQSLECGEGVLQLAYAEALWASGDASGARQAIQAAAQRLIARSQRIANPDRQNSFLTRVPENARTIELAARWA